MEVGTIYIHWIERQEERLLKCEDNNNTNNQVFTHTYTKLVTLSYL